MMVSMEKPPSAPMIELLDGIVEGKKNEISFHPNNT